MTDPFNEFLQNKLANFKKMLSSRMHFNSMFIKELNNDRIPISRGIGEAAILRKPASEMERSEMSSEELKKEDVRLYHRTSIMLENRIKTEVEKLFEE